MSQNSNWPFDDPENVATISLRQIVREGRPILYVTHDEDDGTWQFLTGDDNLDEDDGMVICLGHIVDLDPNVKELADLPLGWRATRKNAGDPWHRERNQE